MYNRLRELQGKDPEDLIERSARAVLYINRLMKDSQSCTTGAAMGFEHRSSWETMSIIDTLIERGFYREVKQTVEVAWQHRIIRPAY